ncbi:formin-like protein 13, partial [Carica papaya]|uniref:formin-like protein 13 n=1 Tax=Carica papaya TaxID=3649 RepID=UPI000B8C7C12
VVASNPIPSQIRYLQYILRRNVVSEWPPVDRALTLDCVILRLIPDFDGQGGCRPFFRIYGQDHFLTAEGTPNILYSSPKKSKSVRLYKQVECELVKIDINCHIQGDVVVECLNLNDDMERETMMFRIVFNTAFIRSNILMLNRDEIDTLWDAREQFPKNFRAELIFSEMDDASAVAAVNFPYLEEKEGLPIEAFAKVHEIFSQVDWLDHKADVALNMLQHLSVTNILQEKSDSEHDLKVATSPRLRERSPRRIQDIINSGKLSPFSGLKVESVPSPRTTSDTDLNKKTTSQDLCAAYQSSRSDIMDQLRLQPVCSSKQDSSLVALTDHSATQAPHGKPLFHDHDTFKNAELSHREKVALAVVDSTITASSGTESPETKIVSDLPPTSSFPLPAPPSTHPESSKSSELSLVKESENCSHDQSWLSGNSQTPPVQSLSTTRNGLLSSPKLPESKLTSPSLLPPPNPAPPISTPPTPPLSQKPAVQARPPPPPPPPLPSGKTTNFSTSSVFPPPTPNVSSNSSKVPAAPPTPPPPPTPPQKENAIVRGGPPTPPPPPLHSGKVTDPVTSSPVPPPLPQTPAMSLNSSALPSEAGNKTPSPPPPYSSPMSTKGRMLRAVNSRSHQTKKLKPLHWLKLTRAVQGSLWAEAQKSGDASTAPEIDMLELENLFSATPNLELRTKSSTHGSCAPKSEKVQLNSVLALEDSALDVDQVENLVKFCPTKEEMELLKGYTGEKEKLGKCEQFFLELMKVPRAESKLRVFSFKMQFQTQVSDLRNSLNVVNSATEEIRNSFKFMRIMQTILSLGNALNQGTARGSAVGFRLDSLLKLSETRARNKKMTLMHYLCKVLADKLPELLDFSKDLASLEPASKIQLKYLAEEMQAINKGLEKVVQELSMSESDGPVSENFHKTLKEFLCLAEAEVRSLASLYSGVGRNVDALIIYFGEDPARCSFEQGIC